MLFEVSQEISASGV